MNYKKILLIVLPFVVLSVFLINIQNNSVPKESSVFIPHKLSVVALERETNAYRISKGLNALANDPSLCEAVSSKLNDMVSKSYFEHYTPSGASPFTFFKGNYIKLGENLANGVKTPQETLSKWQQSPTHNENLVDPTYTKTCIKASYTQYGDVNTVVAWYGKM